MIKFSEYLEEGTGKKKKPEPYEAQFKRRVVKTTKPEHKEKGYNWRIKGKERPKYLDDLHIKYKYEKQPC